MEEAEPARTNSWWPWVIIIAAGVWSVWGALHPFSGDTANSRLATVYALTHHGTWQIDASDHSNPFAAGTVDKVRVNGKMYSSKPPVMPLVMTGVYAALRAVGLLDLDNEADRGTLLKIETLLLIAVPFILSGIAFLIVLRCFGLDDRLTSLGLLALLWGTEYAGYAGTLNNHVPATASLIIALSVYCRFPAEKNVSTYIMCAVAGLGLGFAITVDLPTTVFALVIALAFMFKFPIPNVLCGIAGALIPIGVHCAVMISLHGSPAPFQLNDAYYLYEESYWRDPYGIDGLNHPRGLYLFNMTFGRVGLFLMYPIAAIGFIGILRQLGNREMRPWATAILAAFAVMFFYYGLTSNNYGGASFGFRWLIVVAPFFVLSAMVWMRDRSSPLMLCIVWLAIVISVISAVQCRMNVWSVNQEWPTRIFGPLV